MDDKDEAEIVFRGYGSSSNLGDFLGYMEEKYSRRMDGFSWNDLWEIMWRSMNLAWKDGYNTSRKDTETDY